MSTHMLCTALLLNKLGLQNLVSGLVLGLWQQLGSVLDRQPGDVGLDKLGTNIQPWECVGGYLK